MSQHAAGRPDHRQHGPTPTRRRVVRVLRIVVAAYLILSALLSLGGLSSTPEGSTLTGEPDLLTAVIFGGLAWLAWPKGGRHGQG